MTPTTEIMRDSLSIRRQSVQMNREMIMDTAARLFAESGYEVVSIDDIAREIGATKGLIYHYFPSKSALLGELLFWIHQLFLEHVNPAWEMQGISIEDKLKKVIEAQLNYDFEYPYILTAIYRTAGMVPTEMRQKIRRLRNAYSKKFRTLVEEVQKSGRLVEGDGESVADSIIALAFYFAYQYKNAGQQRRKELYGLILRLYFR